MFKITKTMLTEEEIKARVAELGKQRVLMLFKKTILNGFSRRKKCY